MLNLANLYEDLGRRSEAQDIYARLLALDPRCFEALARLANLQPPATRDPSLIARLQRALADGATSAAERASLGFALGRLLDAAGDYPAAFAAIDAANRSSRASAAPHFVRYDRVRHHAFVDRLIAGDTTVSRKVSQCRPRPIFICGMFRSGSTLTEQLLSGLQGVAAGGEIDFLPRIVASELAPFPESLATLPLQRLDEIAERYQAELKRVSADAEYVIDKRPDNYLYIGLIKSLFPDARIVHTTRNPLDNCLSIFFLHLDQQMSYALDLQDIGHYFREYRRLMTHWKRMFASDIFDFDYDALVNEPKPAMERLGGFLGLDLQSAAPPAAPAGLAVKTASVWQVREPLYRTSSGRSRHYTEQLKELHDYLADLL